MEKKIQVIKENETSIKHEEYQYLDLIKEIIETGIQCNILKIIYNRYQIDHYKGNFIIGATRGDRTGIDFI